MKRCGKCGEVKPLSEFHRCKSHPDGRMSRCRECELQRKRERYADPAYAEERRAYTRAYDASHREQKRAYDRWRYRALKYERLMAVWKGTA